MAKAVADAMTTRMLLPGGAATVGLANSQAQQAGFAGAGR